MKKENLFVILTGVVIGIAALVLTALGNPANMGFCIACFERDIAGAVGLHSASSSVRSSSARASRFSGTTPPRRLTARYCPL